MKPIIATGPYEICSIDVLELGLTSTGFRYVVTVIDAFSSGALLTQYAISQQQQLRARLCNSGWHARLVVQKTLLSDRGREFENKIMNEITKFMGVQQNFTLGHNPRENGMTERMNGTLISVLAKSVKMPSEWGPSKATACVVCIQHETTGESPFFLLHGLDPIMPFDPSAAETIARFMVDLDDYRAELFQGLAEIRGRAKD